ncbi:hypothetical protein C0J52_02307 [Blattella germanica]|nr:hypothetical protein C0J52_02307 [Blattella germanica]
MRDATFPSEIWASDTITSERTTNAYEAFHRAFGLNFNSAHPHIFTFVDAIINTQTSTYIKLNDKDTAPNPAYEKRRIYIEQLICKFKLGDISRLHFLKSSVSFIFRVASTPFEGVSHLPFDLSDPKTCEARQAFHLPRASKDIPGHWLNSLLELLLNRGSSSNGTIFIYLLKTQITYLMFELKYGILRENTCCLSTSEVLPENDALIKTRVTLVEGNVANYISIFVRLQYVLNKRLKKCYSLRVCVLIRDFPEGAEHGLSCCLQMEACQSSNGTIFIYLLKTQITYLMFELKYGILRENTCCLSTSEVLPENDALIKTRVTLVEGNVANYISIFVRLQYVLNKRLKKCYSLRVCVLIRDFPEGAEHGLSCCLQMEACQRVLRWRFDPGVPTCEANACYHTESNTGAFCEKYIPSASCALRLLDVRSSNENASCLSKNCVVLCVPNDFQI